MISVALARDWFELKEPVLMGWLPSSIDDLCERLEPDPVVSFRSRGLCYLAMFSWLDDEFFMLKLWWPALLL